MTITLIVLALMMAVFVGWLFSQSINVRPWIAETSRARPLPRIIPPSVTAPRVGLVVFLAVVTSVFALSISAYIMRMEMGTDWRSVPEPGLLWLNTGVLVLASVALQTAWHAAKHGKRPLLRRTLVAGGILTVAFVIGQLVVWRQLSAAGYYMTANPANAFFYLLTALHALHLLGGLVAWGRALNKLYGGAELARVRAGVELCAVYWHFLLLVWAVLFGLVLTT
ncbi:cytochrome-c oxidase [Litchfieldella qijiaojingensis]|uniref:Cytochrome-c oxidase n=1 Tax=Litchfieldella qijiaojingensis TaxID=980347 RepID=A0ABQ2YEW8_9GAMM|nr:cytochrome c oxidase subunit 3 [Halomonas qijiaojingensis]GGX79848.1 cytochrome-c oxidase [Halomonas qijiaojingensis]